MDQGGCRRDHEVVEITTMPGGAPAATARWNPTKEQITMLENLYRQGIRTPTAEQIQEIAGRLQSYGHIEGKNVFYWFQNHKARQRQKQKQENDFAYLHRYLHHQPVPPLFPPPQYPCPNVVCGPYYVPQPELGFYTHQFPKVLLPRNGIKKNYSYGCSTGGSFNVTSQSNAGFMTKDMEEEYFINGKTQLSNLHHDQETLELFPMHPTGILKARTENPNYSTSNATISSFSGGTAAATSPISSICMSNVAEKCSGTDQFYFDFFSGN